jgi:hypothetical protein
MRLTSKHQRIAALALVTVLALAGAQPAAAAGPGFLDRVASLWSAVTGGEHMGLWDTISGWFGGESETVTPATTKRGAGIDPNGNSTNPEPDTPMFPCPDCGFQ